MMRRSENENAMKKKNEKRPEGGLRSEYDPSKLKGGVRGKYVARYRAGTRQQKAHTQLHTQLARAAVRIFAANERMNQILIEHLDPAAWKAKPPGKARTIAAIFTHMHNVRVKWIRLTAPQLKLPRQLHRAHCSPSQARAGLGQSAARCAEMLAQVLDNSGERVKKFRRDGWARPWPAGVEML